MPIGADIAFPIDLGTLCDPATLRGLSATELGALVRISEVAWVQEPPASVPDTDDRLARWAGVSSEQWRSVRSAIREIFRPGPDGRLHNAALRAAHDSLAAKKAKRSAAGRKAAQVRHQGAAPPEPLRLTSDPHANRMRIASDSHAGRTPPTPPSSERPAPLRSPNSDLNPSAHSSPKSALDSSREEVGAGARALKAKADRRCGVIGDAAVSRDVETLRRLNDQEEVRRILAGAVFEHAPKDRQTVPPAVVDSLSRSKHARPQLALYAVQRATEACRQARANGGAANPIGLLISAFGAQRHGRGRPWEVPSLFIENEWAARQARRAAGEDLRAHIKSLGSRAANESTRGAV